MGTVKQSQAVVWLQENGDGTAFRPLVAGDGGMSMTGKSIPVTGVAPVYARDRFGHPQLIDLNETPPGDLPTATVAIFEKTTLNVLEEMLQRQCPLNFQLRMVECGVLDNPGIWTKISHWSKGRLTTYNPGDGPSLEFDGTLMQAAGTVSFEDVVFVVKTALSSSTSGVTEDLRDIDGIPEEDCAECGTGYPGADQILIAGVEAVGAATAKVRISGDGGSTWNDTSADPFAADEHIDFVAINQIDEDTIRYVVGTGVTDGAADAKTAYADVEYGDLLTTTWTQSLIAGTANGDVITGLGWNDFDRLYAAATGGDVYLSEDQDESWSAAAVLATGVATTVIEVSPDKQTDWVAGATNYIARKRQSSNSWEVRVGPTGGGAFTALAQATDGTVYAGNGTSIFKSVDEGGQAGNWTELRDFGANMAVVAIQCVGGDSQILRAVVDNATPGTATIWRSVDGGLNWAQVTALANDGYNAAYFSEINDNLAVIVGDTDGGVGIIQILSVA